MDRSGQQCQVVPIKEPKSNAWMGLIFEECVEGLVSGNVPDVVYPIDEDLEKSKEIERASRFSKVS